VLYGLLASIALLAGCVSDPPIVETEVKTVQVPVTVYCVDSAKEPTVPPQAIVPPTASKRQRALATAAELSALRAYAIEADSELRGCVAPPPPPEKK
jgi:hypothetical protein